MQKEASRAILEHTHNRKAIPLRGQKCNNYHRKTQFTMPIRVAQARHPMHEDWGSSKRFINVMMWLMILISIFIQLAISQFTSNEGQFRDTSTDNCKPVNLDCGVKNMTWATPDYPQLALVEDICWVIQIGLSPSLYEEHFIEVAMNDMDLHVTGDCNSQTSDQVVLVEGSSFNGTHLERWCHGWDSNHVVISCASKVLLKVQLSHRSVEHRGVNFTYKTIPKDTYDCNLRKWKADVTSNIGDAAIAGVAAILIILVVLISIIVILKTRQRPHNRDDRAVSSFWQSPFDHRRFENEEAQGQNFMEGNMLPRDLDPAPPAATH